MKVHFEDKALFSKNKKTAGQDCFFINILDIMNVRILLIPFSPAVDIIFYTF